MQVSVAPRRLEGIRSNVDWVDQNVKKSERVGAVRIRELALGEYTEARSLGNKLHQAEALLRLGQAFAPMVQPGLALPLIRHAQKIFAANALPLKASACGVVAAYALYDLGEESNAILSAETALSEATLPTDYRVAAVVVSALSHARLGRFESAICMLRSNALPLVDGECQSALRAFTLRALATISLTALMGRYGARFWSGSDNIGANTTCKLQLAGVIELLESAATAAPSAHHQPYVEISLLLVRGLYGPSAGCADALTRIASSSVATDPPLAGWALHCGAMVMRKSGQLTKALDELSRAEVIARESQQLLLLREITWQRAGIGEQMADLESALSAYKKFSAMRLRSALQSEHLALSSNLPDRVPEPAVQESSPADQYTRILEPACVRRAAQYIDQHLAQRLLVSDIAAHCEVSRRTLEVAFKTTRCETVAEYLRRKRLERAVETLRLTNRSISDVAKSVGFKSTYLFNTAFIAMFGVNAKSWRQSEALRREGSSPG